MLSILPTDLDNISCVPVEVFQERIRDAIEEKTGKRPSVKELQKMDIGDVERILEIKATRPTKIGRNSPSSLYKFRSPGSVAYNKAVVSGSLMKKDFLN